MVRTPRTSPEPPQVSSVSEFVTHVMQWTSEGQKPVAFRGQSFHDWRTEPKLFRRDVGLYEHEKNAVRDLVSIHPQHFNLPTRLLDVTANPLVALFFATETYIENGKEQDGKVQALFVPDIRQRYYDSDRVSCMANLANLTIEEKVEITKAYELEREEFNKNDAVKRLLWFVRIEKPHFEANIDPSDIKLPVYVKPKMSNRRIIAQSGAFIIFGAKKISNVVEMKLKRVKVPAVSKDAIRGELERLGIHASALFPEIDKSAEFIVQRYRRLSSASRR